MTAGKSPDDKQCKAFTLLELIIAVSLLVIIVILAVVKLNDAKTKRMEGMRAHNEAGAVGNLRYISSAEERYNARNGNYCSLGDLYANGAYIDQLLSSATDVNNTKAGYYYTLVVSGAGDEWCCIARPSVWGTTGLRNFRIDQTGAIYYNKTKDSNEFNRALGS